LVMFSEDSVIGGKINLNHPATNEFF